MWRRGVAAHARQHFGVGAQRSIGHCQSKFYTGLRGIATQLDAAVFAHESVTASVRFDAGKVLYSFALTVPSRLSACSKAERRHANVVDPTSRAGCQMLSKLCSHPPTGLRDGRALRLRSDAVTD
jgi:hypothetical protein